MDNESGKKIRFFVEEDEEGICVTEEGFFGVNSEEPIGQLSVSGDSYITHIEHHAYGQWGHIYPGPEDETVGYNTILREGEDSHLISFPKTFDGPPVLSVSVKHEKGGVIIPFMISGLTDSQFNINFTSSLPDSQYKASTIAISTGSSDDYKRAMDTEKIQRFVTPINSGSLSYQINFPIHFPSTPIISTTIEGEKKFPPHFISDITKSGYNIVFGTKLEHDYKVHTTSTLEGSHSKCEPDHRH